MIWRTSFIIILLATSKISFAQLSNLEKLIGENFVAISLTEKYVWIPTAPDLKIDTSKTIKGDTTGVSLKGVYAMFRDPIIYKNKKEEIKFTNTTYVSNKEWNEFQAYITDSIAKRILGEEFPEEYLIRTYDIENNELDSEDWFINTQKKINWKGEIEKALLYQMMVYYNSRLFKHNELDNRKLIFEYYRKGYDEQQIHELCASIRDSTLWSNNSTMRYDLPYIIGLKYNHHKIFNSYPVVGILATQAYAFLNYKEKILQREIDKKGLPYEVYLSLPTEKEIKQLKEPLKVRFEKRDHTEHWRITNKDYAEFLSYVKDSIIRKEIIFSCDSATTWKLGKNKYDVELDLLDYEDWDLNYKAKIKVPSKGISHLFNVDKSSFQNDSIFKLPQDITKGVKVNEDGFLPQEYYYEYFWKDLQRASQFGNFGETRPGEGEYQIRYYSQLYWVGKDLSLGYTNEHGYNTGVRSHDNLSRFIINEEIYVYPGIDCENCNSICRHENGDKDITSQHIGCDDKQLANVQLYDFQSQPDALIKNITYKQACAYYNWKFSQKNIWNIKGDPLELLLPTEDQFHKVQNGKEVIIEEKVLDYPSPLFSYTIHVFRKNN